MHNSRQLKTSIQLKYPGIILKTFKAIWVAMDEENYFIKGPVFLSLINYLKEKKGQRGVDQIFDLLKEEAPDVYMAPNEFTTKDMYREAIFLKLLELVDRELGAGDLSECYRFGYYDSHHLGVMGYFVSFLGTPTKILQKAPKSWKYYHKKGELVVPKLEPGLGIIELHGYLKSEVMCAEILGYLTGAAEQTKGKNVKVEETQCVCKGDSVCQFKVTWEQ